MGHIDHMRKISYKLEQSYILYQHVCFKKNQTRCVCETQMPLIMDNSKDGQDHKDKYFDTSRKILSQEMTMCNMKALIFYILEGMTNVNFFFQMSRPKY